MGSSHSLAGWPVSLITDPEGEIRRRISRRGKITFREFMELALYWPDGGYYAGSHLGGPGDYYTSPAAHPVFGALICVHLYQMWMALGRPDPFWVVEAGAGSGLLCHSLVSLSSAMPTGFPEALRYLCLDRQADAGLESELPSSLRVKVHRLEALGVPLRGLVGCVLSNELLDSFPVHRVMVRDGRLMEVYVTQQGGKLMECVGAPSTPVLERRLESVGVVLGEGSYGEINLDMDGWVGQAAATLERGYLITIDYGAAATELYSERRRRGTRTTFHQHVQTDSPFHHIGQQDITAQVDFTALHQVGEEKGLRTEGIATQRQYLLNLGMGEWMRRLVGEDMPQREVDANRMGMQELVRPGGMGDFKVLVQSKGVEDPALWGLQESDEAKSLMQGLPLPRLTRLNMPLLQARYPHAAFDWESLWPSGLDSAE